MAGTVFRSMEIATLSGSKTQEPERVFDGGAYSQLMVVIYLKAAAGTTGSFDLLLEQAAVNEDEAYAPLKDINGTAISFDLTSTEANYTFQADGLLRYVRWRADDGGTTPSPVAIVGMDFVAKE